MEMDREADHKREVKFLLWSGCYTVDQLAVDLYAKEGTKDVPSKKTFQTIICTPKQVETGKVWEASAKLEHDKQFWYTYVVKDFRGKGSDHGGYADQERDFRKLRPGISCCHDILRLQQLLHEDDILHGFLYHLGVLLDRANDPRDLQLILEELEHMCEKEDRVFANKNVKHCAPITEFTMSAISKYSDSNEKVLFLSVVYGMLLARCTGNPEVGKTIESDKIILTRIRDAISCGKNCVTRWSLPFLVETGKEVLKHLKEYNWLYFVLHFPYVFQNVEEMISFKDRMGDNVDGVPFQDVVNVIMPMILIHLDDQPEPVVNLVLEQIPYTQGFEPTPEELQRFYEEIRGQKAVALNQEAQPDGTSVDPPEFAARLDPQLSLQQDPSDLSQQELTEAKKIMTSVPDSRLNIHETQPIWTELEVDTIKTSVPYAIRIQLMAHLKECQYVTSCRIHYRYFGGNEYTPVYSRDIKLAKLHLTGCLGGKDSWHFGKIDLTAPPDKITQYRYSVCYTVQGRILVANNRNIIEKQWRHSEAPKQVSDVLEDPNAQSKHRTFTSCLGKLMHARQSLSLVKKSNLKSYLLGISDMGFDQERMAGSFRNLFVKWMEETLGLNGGIPVTESQIVYIAMLFGIVLKSTNTCVDHSCFSLNTLATLLWALQRCRPVDIPSTMQSKEIKDVCTWLTVSLGLSWFSLRSNFLHLFSVPDLVHLAPCEHYRTIFSVNNVTNDIRGLGSALITFTDRPDYFQQCLIFAIQEIRTIGVLAEVLEVASKEAFALLRDDEAIDMVLTVKIKEIMTYSSAPSQSTMKHLTRIWGIVSQTTFSTMAAEVRQRLICYLSQERWSGSDDQAWTLLLDGMLFENNHEFMNVMKNMLNDTSDEMHSHEAFIDVVSKQPFIHELQVDDIKKLAERAVQSYTPLCRKPNATAQPVKLIFKLQENIEIQFSNTEPVLKKTGDSIYKLMKILSASRLFEILVTADEEWSTKGLQLLTDLISRKLHEDRYNITPKYLIGFAVQLQDKSGTSRFEYATDVLVTILDILYETNFSRTLDISATSDAEKLQPIIADVVEQSDFWHTLFSVTPPGSNRLRNHKCLKAVCKNLNDLISVVEEKQLTISFLEMIEKHEPILTSLLKIQKPVSEREKIVMQWQTSLNVAVQWRTSFNKHLQNLEKLLDGFINYLLQSGSDFKKYKEALSHLLKSMNDVTLDKTREESFWGQLYPILSPASNLAPLASSVMFLNVSRLFFEGSLTDLDSYLLKHTESGDPIRLHVDLDAKKSGPEVEDLNETEDYNDSATYERFVNLLSSCCLQYYRQYGELIFDCRLGVSVQLMENFVVGISTPETLGKELNLLRTSYVSQVNTITSQDNHGQSTAVSVKKRDVPNEMKAAIESLITLDELQQRANQLPLLFTAFGIDSQNEPIQQVIDTIDQLTDPEQYNSFTLGNFHLAVQKVNTVKKKFTDEEWDIVEELVKGVELLRFLRDVIGVDLRVLIDAVEERSEEYVNESTVSDLIEVKRYIEPLLQVKGPHHAQQLVDAIVKNRDLLKKTKGDMNKKINNCVNNIHSLEDLYNNVANRGELTKEIIQNALALGSYQFTLTNKDEECKVQLTYKRGKEIAKYGLSELNDLRSRALLILHSQKHSSPSTDGQNQTKTSPSTDGQHQAKTSPSTDGQNQTKTSPSTDGQNQTKTSPSTDDQNQIKTSASTDGQNQAKTSPSIDDHNQTQTSPSTDGQNQTKTSPSTDGQHQAKTSLSTDGQNQTKTSPSTDGQNQTKTSPSTDDQNQIKTSASTDGQNQAKTSPSIDDHNQTQTPPLAVGQNETKTSPSTDVQHQRKTDGQNQTKMCPSTDGQNQTKTSPSTDGQNQTKTSPSTDGQSQIKTSPSTDGQNQTMTSPSTDGQHQSKTSPSTDSQNHTSVITASDLQNFIDSVNAVNDILRFCKWLIDVGHFQFVKFSETCINLDQLQVVRNRLEKETDEWQRDLEEARTKYHFLNFIHSKQLRLFDDFFNNKTPVTDELILLFQFVNNNVVVDDKLKEYYRPSLQSKRSIKTKLFDLGATLHEIFNSHEPQKKRPIPGLSEWPDRNKDAEVKAGSVFVVELDTTYCRSVHVLMSLYLNTTGFLPEPSQVVFCHAETSWEEVYLLLRRCEIASHRKKDKQLQAFVNVERLSTEIQYKLVAKLREMEAGDEDNFLLALLCSGSTNHVIEQFSRENIHILHGLKEEELQACLRTGWSGEYKHGHPKAARAPEPHRKQGVAKVEFLTSSQAGLGKSEYVKVEASRAVCGVTSILVSGPITKGGLIEQLKFISKKRHSILHVDCAQMTDVSLFDSFIFEVVVIGMAVSGTSMCASPFSQIILEIANTQQDILRNSFQVSSLFDTAHIEWSGFDKFVVSRDINSPVQVVCLYLKSLKANKLDNSDIILTGQRQAAPLGSAECRSILRPHFGKESGLSFTVIETFLNILAQELRRMSASLYFQAQNIDAMVGKGSKVRSSFIHALLDVSKHFSARSVKYVTSIPSSSQNAMATLIQSRSSRQVSAEDKVARVQGMIKWHESNHLFTGFHRQDSQTVTAVYRDLSQVPSDIQTLYKTQLNRQLNDYQRMSHDELQTELERICRKSTQSFERECLGELQANYALTPDNFLKMVLIFLRVESLIPVIIMGETGCGKTTLITYLAKVCGVSFHKLNLHAGIVEKDIEMFVVPLVKHAEESPCDDVWGFLDEINTCDHLGLLNDIICHRRFRGMQLPFNLTFVAACNPYRLRKDKTQVYGLRMKDKIPDEQAKLVYRVHELPETMMDYVWDYGALNETDEEAYIRRMLGDKRDRVFGDLIIKSQKFIRKIERNSHCVSLRDVRRCDHLEYEFRQMFDSGRKDVVPIYPQYSKGCTELLNRKDIRSITLALCHCYHARLTMGDDRKRYRSMIAEVLSQRKIATVPVSEYQVNEVICLEQMGFLKRMHPLPKGTAKNEALRENVFVILVSILARIPVFVVGKPGCSKSLSMRLIRSAMRGPDSTDKFFKTLPAVYVISYQGSESSTSEGIIKVFEKASNYEEYNPKVRPVVLLDEIGLAETSKSNPLKVLHSYLEPKMGDFPAFAVVGISNWALDSAKMNRAIHLSRPEPSKEDLSFTAKSIRDDAASPVRLESSLATTDDRASLRDSKRSKRPSIITDDYLTCLADAYVDYENQQKIQNFHGLRDYYCLVKYVAIQAARPDVNEPGDIIEKGLVRNFSGSRMGMNDIMNIFSDKVNFIQRPDSRPTVMGLIHENLTDKSARHLMLITSGDASLSILERSLQQPNQESPGSVQEYRTIFGSRLENDISEEYNYRMLSEIILCMERGLVLIMRDLENIYGSLYDMLNQNYVEIGKKQICRVALGPYSNPMCEIHPQFRCIVLLDDKKVEKADPPFLNRFEKQILNFSEILTRPQKEAILSLKRWVQDLFTAGEQFSGEESLLGYHDDTVRSLVYWRSSQSQTEDYSELVEKCKDDLLKIASPDAVLRFSKSKLYQAHFTEVENLQRKYFALPIHRGLKHFLNSQQDPFGKFVVYTQSSFHTDIAKCLQGIAVQTHKLGNFKSERDLSNKIQEFWNSPASVLIIQCIISQDAQHMPLLKSRIDQIRHEQMKEREDGGEAEPKHVCIIIHLGRFQKTASSQQTWHFNFLSGWEQFAIDSLDGNTPLLDDLLRHQVSSIFNSNDLDWNRVIDENLLWSFSCIKYSDESRSVERCLTVAGPTLETPYLKKHLKLQISKYLRDTENTDETCFFDPNGWHTQVACDKGLLVRSSTLKGAMLEQIKHYVRVPLAKIIIFLENECAWPEIPTASGHGQQKWEFWENCFNDNAVFNIHADDIGDPSGGETCQIDGRQLTLKFPFFAVFYRIIEKHRSWLLNAKYEHSIRRGDGTHLLRSLGLQLADLMKHTPSIGNKKFLEDYKEEYCHDLCNVFAQEYAPSMDEQTRIDITIFLLKQVELEVEASKDAYEYIANKHVTLWLKHDILAAELQLIALDANTIENTKAFITRIKSDTMLKDSLSVTSADTEADEYVADESEETGQFTEEKSDENTAGNQQDVDEHIESDMTLKDPLSVTSADTETGEYVADGSEQTGQITEDTADKQIVENQQDVDEYSLKDTGSGCSEDEETFETKLVSEICKSVLPSNISRFDEVAQWHQKANRILLHAGKVSTEPSVLHFLRLCRDFVNLCIESNFQIATSKIKKLATLAEASNLQNVLDNERIFDFISAEMDHLMKQENVEVADIQTVQVFKCMYYNLCLDANLDTPLQKKILPSLISDTGDLYKGSRPVLINIIQNDIVSEDGHVSSVCKDIIFDDTLNAYDYPNLALLDEVLRAYDVESHFVVACSDIIEEEAFHDITKDHVQSLDSEHSTLLDTAKQAIQIVFQSSKTKDQKSSFRYVCAGAFLRSFITSTASFLQSRKKSFHQEHYRPICTAIDEIIRLRCRVDEHSGLSTLTIFLCKSMRTNMSLYELKNWCDYLPTRSLRALKEVKFNEALFTSRLGYNPMSYLVHYKDTVSVVATFLKDHQRDEIAKLITKIESSPEPGDLRLGVLAAIAEQFYFSRSVKDIAVSDKEERVWLQQELKRLFAEPVRHFLRCLLGTAPFDVFLDLAQKTSDHNLQIVSVITHLACIDASLDRVYTKRTTAPGKSHNKSTIIIPAQSKNIRRSDCKCGCSMVFQQKDEGTPKCPTCQLPAKSLPTEIFSSMLIEKPASVQDIICSIINSCLYIVRSLYRKEQVVPGTAKPITSQHKHTSSQSTRESDTHFQNIYRNVETLRNVLDDDLVGVASILHTVIQTIQRSSSANDDFMMQAINQVVADINGNQKRYKKECLTAQCESNRSVEYMLEELDKWEDYNEQERLLLRPRLFRIVHQPSFEHFQLQFNLEMTSQKSVFRFLRLFFLRQNALRLVKHLPVFLKWHTLIWKKLCQVISRKESKTMTVSIMLRKEDEGHFKSQTSETLCREYTSLQKAWNEVCDNWKILTGKPLLFNALSHDSAVSNFLMDTDGMMCPLLTIIDVLQRTQNKFLEEALYLASTSRSSSLSFLFKDIGIAGMQHVALNEATSEIINFDWSNDILVNSDVGLECGQGSVIKYNFIIIERELADKLLMNKAILTDGTVFASFPFTGDIASMVSSLLVSIPKEVPQTHLSDAIKTTVRNKEITYVCDLMEHLEIILVLLKKTGGGSSDSLHSYIQRWNSQLPMSFPSNLLPEPRNDIKLSHVVHLFKTLEDQYSDRFVESLPMSLRDPIPDADKNALIKYVQEQDADEVKKILISLRRFIFRCLRNNNSLAEDTIESKLTEVIKRSGIDGDTTNILTTLISDATTLCTKHVFKTQDLIYHQLQLKTHGEGLVSNFSSTEPLASDVQEAKPAALINTPVKPNSRNGGKPRRRRGGIKGPRKT